METNLGSIDRRVRVTLGAVAFALVFAGPKSPFGLLGVLLLLTGLTGFCPVYHVLGISTGRRAR